MNYYFEERERRIITTTKTEKTLFIGLDLGQAKDFSALAVVECIRNVATTYFEGLCKRKKEAEQRRIEAEQKRFIQYQRING
jgi:phage terminase large subunit-like protein